MLRRRQCATPLTSDVACAGTKISLSVGGLYWQRRSAARAGAGETADASAHREKTSLSSQRSAKKCLSSTTSTVTSPVPAHRLPVAQVAPCPRSLASPAGPPVVGKTCRPSLTAAAQQAPLRQKVYHLGHHCPRRPRVCSGKML